MSLVSVVCWQASATGRSFVRGNPTDCGVSECDIGTCKMRGPRPAATVDP